MIGTRSYNGNQQTLQDKGQDSRVRGGRTNPLYPSILARYVELPPLLDSLLNIRFRCLFVRDVGHDEQDAGLVFLGDCGESVVQCAAGSVYDRHSPRAGFKERLLIQRRDTREIRSEEWVENMLDHNLGRTLHVASPIPEAPPFC
jgi:hypothetical protein